jgi:hypothetical protein
VIHGFWFRLDRKKFVELEEFHLTVHRVLGSHPNFPVYLEKVSFTFLRPIALFKGQSAERKEKSWCSACNNTCKASWVLATSPSINKNETSW